MSIGIEAARYLLGPEGAELLADARSAEGDLLRRLSSLRKRYPADLAAAAIELLDLRARASLKFARADEMFFTREALEQSSGEMVSRYRAGRITEGATVFDLGCGIGGDTIALAQRGPVHAIDSDPVRILMAERNVAVYGLSHRVTFSCGDFTTMPLDSQYAFIDPSRRSGGRRTTRLAEMNPPLDFLQRLISTVDNCCIKLSPASDDDELRSLGGEVEFISAAGECREAVVWTGQLRDAGVRATVLPGSHSIADVQDVSVPVGGPGRYLYEPDPCVIRAHMVGWVAQSIGAWRLDEMVAYITSDSLRTTPFAESYQIVVSLQFNLKHVQAELRALDAGSVIVKKRGVPFEPEDIRKRLKLHGRREFILVLARVGDRTLAMICREGGASE